MDNNESVKAALIALDLKPGASLENIRAEYLDKTSQHKFQRGIISEEHLQQEFADYYKSYVTLVKYHAEAKTDSHVDYYPHDQGQMFQYHLNQGIYHFIKQKYITAGEIFQEAFKLNNRNIPLLVYLGVLLLKRKVYYAAEKYFKDAIEIDENCEDAWFYLGDNYFKAGEFKKALDTLETCQKLNPVRSELAYLVKEVKEKLALNSRPDKKPSFLSKIFKFLKNNK